MGSMKFTNSCKCAAAPPASVWADKVAARRALRARVPKDMVFKGRRIIGKPARQWMAPLRTSSTLSSQINAKLPVAVAYGICVALRREPTPIPWDMISPALLQNSAVSKQRCFKTALLSKQRCCQNSAVSKQRRFFGRHIMIWWVQCSKPR